MTGAPDWNPPERAARLREVVEILDQMLRNEVTTYQDITIRSRARRCTRARYRGRARHLHSRHWDRSR